MSSMNSDLPASVPSHQVQVVAENSGSTAAEVPVWPVDYESYQLLGKVGRGAFATVWRAECYAPSQSDIVQVQPSQQLQQKEDEDQQKKKKRFCAIKVLDLEHVDTNFCDIRLEVQTMRLSSHPNIVSIYTSFIQGSNLWLVMQLMNKGSSLHCLQSARMIYHKYNNHQRLSSSEQVQQQQTKIRMEPHITYILHETILGLKYIHDNGQIHRDVKAGNILLDAQGNVRIADFGVSSWLTHSGSKRENTRTFVGTPCWMAPEVMEQVHGYDTKADIWSLGITSLELAKGYAPYAKYPPMKVLLLTIQEDPPSFDTYLEFDDLDDEDDEWNQIHDEWSDSFKSMINLCLQKNPRQRPNCEELLAHPHFQALSDPVIRDEYRTRIKVEICDKIDDVGDKREGGAGGRKNVGLSSSNHQASVCIIPPTSTSDNVPAGTTWIFSDGSQVSASQTGGSADDGDTQDFFDQFERATQGENFRHPSIAEEPEIKGNRDIATLQHANQTATAVNEEDKDDMNAFFDQFERETSGENAKREA